MTYEIVMPQLGLTMEEGAVVCWQKQVGDWVKKGEILFVVETDKTEMEVESSSAGYLNSVCVEVKQKVPVGTVIAILGDKQGEIASAPAPTDVGTIAATAGSVAETAPAPLAESIRQEPAVFAHPSASSEQSSAGDFAVSPRARRLARELGVDLKLVTPARGERIVEEDVRRFHELQGTG